VARFYREAAILEGDQWRIIENLRTKAPENERELARQIADQLEEESPDSRKEPPESAKRNKTRGEISRKCGVNCSRSVADPRSGANKPRILEPVRTILKKSEGCLRHKSCCPDQTWSTGKR
jgi:hypothetical protein